MKVCSKCKISKDESEFYKDKKSKDKLKYQCKTCQTQNIRKTIIPQVKFICDFCKQEKSCNKYCFAKKKTNTCQNCCSKHLLTGKRREHLSRDKSKRWKGGRYISSDGYVMVKIEGRYDPSGRQLYKREHILVIEEILGRELNTTRGGNGEQVHHIDGDKQNNQRANLLLCTNLSSHKSIEHQLISLAFELVKSGLIKFNHETREYFLNETN